MVSYDLTSRPSPTPTPITKSKGSFGDEPVPKGSRLDQPRELTEPAARSECAAEAITTRNNAELDQLPEGGGGLWPLARVEIEPFQGLGVVRAQVDPNRNARFGLLLDDS